jgi:erythronate-4-phosphate dehydrogenase
LKIIADENIPLVKEAFATFGEVTTLPGREITSAHLQTADILLARSVTAINQQLLNHAPIKFVGVACTGTEQVDLPYLQQHEIGFANAPGANANSVAQYVMAALMALQKRGKIDFKTLKVGIVGVGDIGRKVAAKLANMGVTVLKNDPPLAEHSLDSSEFLALDDLMDCDVLTLHVPLTYEGEHRTANFFNADRLAKLKKGAILINMSRGEVLDEVALKQALRTKKLGGTVLDVWQNEPNIDMELLSLVDLGTPHVAGYAYEGKILGVRMIYEAACAYFGKKATFDFDAILATDKARVVANIEKDDVDLRKILTLRQEDRAQYFDFLRKNYQG